MILTWFLILRGNVLVMMVKYSTLCVYSLSFQQISKSYVFIFPYPDSLKASRMENGDIFTHRSMFMSTFLIFT